MIAMIDYDAGNIMSVEKAVRYLGEDVTLTRDREQLLGADKVILPGVGSFGDAMQNLMQYGLDDVIREIVAKEIPLLGICLGLQVLFEGSEESPEVKGLGLLRGTIRRFPEGANGEKIPHMGWNSLSLSGDGRLFAGVDNDAFVYFVHSYYLHAQDRSIAKATCSYITEFDASIEAGNLFGCQFHPEKSGDVGLCILNNFLKI